MRTVKSIRSLWSHILSPAQSICWVLAVGRCPAAAGEGAVVAVAALLPVAHLLQVSYQQATFSASGFAHALFQTVVARSRGEQSRGRSKGQQSQGASSNSTICPSCLQSVAWQPTPPRRCVWPSTVTHQHRHSFRNPPAQSWALLSQTREIQRCWVQAGADPPSLFTGSCAVGSSSPTEINGIMNTN